MHIFGPQINFAGIIEISKKSVEKFVRHAFLYHSRTSKSYLPIILKQEIEQKIDFRAKRPRKAHLLRAPRSS